MLEKIAVVILNWNGRDFLEKFLPGVLEHSKGARIIVADNGSTDDSVSYLQSQFPEVELIISETNGGFTKGYNEALKQIDSEFYLLLNNDVEVTAGWLEPLSEAMNDPKVAACQPKILSHANKGVFEHAGASGGYMDRNYYPFCRGRILNRFEEDKGQYDGETEIFWATGACMLIRSELFHQVGGFDEDLFTHMEEIDLCWRIKRLGHKILAIPSAKVYHVGGGTLSYMSAQKTYLNFRNSLFMITKNHEGPLFPKIFWRLCLDGMAAMLFISRGRFNFFGAVFKAHMAYYGKLGLFLKKRKTIKKMDSNFNPTGLFTGNLMWNKYVKGVNECSRLNQRLFK